MKFETKINGGKLFLDGKEIKLKNDNGILTGKIFVVEEKDILVSAGDLRIDGDHVMNLSPEEFKELITAAGSWKARQANGGQQKSEAKE